MIEGEDLEDLPMGDPEKVPDEADMDKANDIRYYVNIFLLRYQLSIILFFFITAAQVRLTIVYFLAVERMDFGLVYIRNPKRTQNTD